MGLSTPVRTTILAVLAWTCAVAAPAAAQNDPLARARALYNDRQFDAAIAAAEEGRRLTGRGASADLIASRAYLERFRESGFAADLVSGRDGLRRIDPHRLGVRERIELVVGLGQALYFEESPGAAAEVFRSVLDGPITLDAAERERVLDWWASARDGDARPRADIERRTVYREIYERMRDEMALNPASAAAAYWLAAAARGNGDLQGAWDAAQAGWVRAPLTADRGAALRGDLDRLVQRAIIPERARMLSQSPERLREEWDRFKERWNK